MVGRIRRGYLEVLDIQKVLLRLGISMPPHYTIGARLSLIVETTASIANALRYYSLVGPVADQVRAVVGPLDGIDQLVHRRFLPLLYRLPTFALVPAALLPILSIIGYPFDLQLTGVIRLASLDRALRF